MDGGHRERLAAALADVGVDVTWTAEPVAVARAVRAGGTVAVYDLGGGRFDAAVVRRGDAGFDVVGRPEGLADIGAAIADLVWRHVRAGLPEGVVPDARVRRACARRRR